MVQPLHMGQFETPQDWSAHQIPQTVTENFTLLLVDTLVSFSIRVRLGSPIWQLVINVFWNVSSLQCCVFNVWWSAVDIWLYVRPRSAGTDTQIKVFGEILNELPNKSCFVSVWFVKQAECYIAMPKKKHTQEQWVEVLRFHLAASCVCLGKVLGHKQYQAR